MKCTSSNDCPSKSPALKCKATIRGYCSYQQDDPPLTEGYYYLKQTGSTKPPPLVYLKKLGAQWCFGFNAFDGGTFLPLDELPDGKEIVPALVSAP